MNKKHFQKVKKKADILKWLIEEWMRNQIWKERKIVLGKNNQDKVFYIIRRDVQIEGVFSVVNSVLGALKYAEEKGYIPVIDMKHYYSNCWQGEDKKWKENSWEYFFSQPAGYGLKDIEKSRHVILGQDCAQLVAPYFMTKIFFSSQKIDEWNYYYKKYIRLNRKTQDYVDMWRKKIFPADGRILGVSVRMSVIKREKMKPDQDKKFLEIQPDFSGYPKQPDLEKLISVIEDKMKEWGYRFFLISIDDSNSLDYLKQHFGKQMVTVDRPHGSCGDEGLKTRYRKKLQRGYLTEIYLLAECESIICGRASGTAAAFVINGNRYKHKYIF